MFQLSDIYHDFIGRPLPSQYPIACEILDPYLATLNRRMPESISCYCYSLVTGGDARIQYDGKECGLKENDLFIFAPGMRVKTLEVSSDFSAYCLMADEKTTYEIPFARNIVAASYFPAGSERQNVMSLQEADSAVLAARMKEIIKYSLVSHRYKKECLYSLYSLFILDLLNIQNQSVARTENSNLQIDLFLRFSNLANENFASHHDIRFYADKLAVTSIYLSRVVKKMSGRTVKYHIDRLITMEASHLLLNTNLPISRIGEMLHFSNSASFTRFFIRQKGVSPKEYRLSKPS